MSHLADRLDALGYKPVNPDQFECTGCQTRYPSINSARQCCQWDGRGWD
jgi:hypothetical protein